MSKTDQLIAGADIEAAKDEYRTRGRLACLKDLRAREPDLYEAVSRIAIDALTDVDLSCPGQAQESTFEAVLQAVLVALIAYQRCHYMLWAETSLGTHLASIDPSLATFARRRRRKSGRDPKGE